MSDLISRQAAIDILYDFAGCIVDTPNGDYHKAYKAYRHRLEILLSAQPEPRTGRWEYVDYGGVGNYHCTACGEICICNGDYDFCPNCGAKMLKDGEE